MPLLRKECGEDQLRKECGEHQVKLMYISSIYKYLE